MVKLKKSVLDVISEDISPPKKDSYEPSSDVFTRDQRKLGQGLAQMKMRAPRPPLYHRVQMVPPNKVF